MKIRKSVMIASLTMLGLFAQIYAASGQNILTKDKCKLKEVGGRFGCLVGGTEVEISANVYNMLPTSTDGKEDKNIKNKN